MGKYLLDAAVIRPLIIAIVVIYHAFIIYSGGWEEPIGFQSVKLYGWIAKFFNTFQMPAIIFVSGYIYGYQQLTLGRFDSLKDIVIKKFKRLVLPGVFFSLIYFFMFYRWEDYTFLSSVLKILSGVGHLWFLPMLFWCFVVGKILVNMCFKRLPGQLNQNELGTLNSKCGLEVVISKDVYVWMSFLFLLMISLFPCPLPLGLGSATRYMVFFWGGFLVWRYHDWIIGKTCDLKYVVLIVSCFLFLFLLSNYFFIPVSEDQNLIWRLTRYMVNRIVILPVSIFGVCAIYLLTNYVIDKCRVRPASWVVNAGAICFGVYIYQQFVLEVLYYKTSLPQLVGPYWLPWIACVVTFVLSIMFSQLTLKTRLGRYLIG